MQPSRKMLYEQRQGLACLPGLETMDIVEDQHRRIRRARLESIQHCTHDIEARLGARQEVVRLDTAAGGQLLERGDHPEPEFCVIVVRLLEREPSRVHI